MNLLHAALHLTTEMSCRFQSLEEAEALAYYLGNICPEPERLRCGLVELFTNAIEHGNLEISYSDKTKLLLENRLGRRSEKKAFPNPSTGIDMFS